MNHKRYLFNLIILSIFLTGCVQETELPTYYDVQMTVNAKVDNEGIDLSGELQTGGQQILERGFILKRTVSFPWRNNIIRIDTLKLENNTTSFIYRVDSYMADEASCEAYAYARLDRGLYRSPSVSFTAGGKASTTITSMKILPIDNGMTGTIVVDGKNFPLNEHVFYLGKDTSWIAPAWFNSWLIEASSTQLKFGYQCNQIGETPIYLKIDQQYFRFDTPLKVEGAHLAKLIPPSPRVGEEVEVVIEDAITDEQYGLYSSMNDSHYSLYAKNKIIFPLIAEQTNLTLFYGNGLNRLYSNTLPITFSFPWKPIGSLPYSYQEIYIEDKWGYICNSQTLHRFSLTGGDQKSWKIAYPDSVDWGKFNPQSKCTDIYATEDDVYISVNAPVKTQSGKNKVEFFLLRFRQIEERWEILTHFPAPSYAKIAQCGRNLLVNIDHRDLFVYHLDNNTSQLHYNKLTDRVYLGNTDKGYFYFLRRHAVNYWQCYRINADGSGEAQAIGSLVPYLLNDIQNLKIANGFLYISDPMARLSLNEKDAKWEYLGTPRNLYADLFQIWPTSDAIYSTVSNSILLYRFEDDRK